MDVATTAIMPSSIPACINVENVFNKDYASVGYRRTVSDAGRRDGTMSPFLYYFRGVPRTLRASYGVAF